jgi:hypothetical protein
MPALVEKLQPRLQNARKLIAENKVRIDRRTAEQVEAYVAGSGVEHRVRLSGKEGRCTLPVAFQARRESRSVQTHPGRAHRAGGGIG